ncbi:uncharacterized protein I206_107660 [Kwoniella pini CBS 10737]|uniref:Rho termination factor-like N-terminal domain-containing protein n=1 Tax=Kwoniella pini CBS 10737 TaxID=1296096 RepID=A0A1B9HXX9_9TREE|nr:uncharacterized protein I206_05995 [Kwoniella pini CBS 10737]OCF48127.1 hypothetical protein I206_05995 [Kwoniella pini CBS 10737]
MHTAESLTKLKVPELKAICKEIKVANFSKLNKASLINLILANHTKATDPKAKTSATNNVPFDPFLLTSPGTTESPETGTKRIISPPKDEIVTKKKKTDNEGKCVPAYIELKENQTCVSRIDPLTSLGKTRDQADKVQSLTVNALSKNRNAAPVTSIGRRINSVPHHVDRSRSAKAFNSEKKRFQALKPSVKAPQKAPSTTDNNIIPAVLDSEPLATANDRKKSVRSSFLEEMFLHLNASRMKPISGPHSSPTLALNSDLSTLPVNFPGLGTALYDPATPKDAFIVALRFYIARLHTSMYQGSGESWSMYGRGVGLLGPDLSKWPIIIDCKHFSRDFWMVETDNLSTLTTSNLGITKYIAIGLNGDVIASSLDGSEKNDIQGCPIRKDWYDYIITNPVNAEANEALLDHVRTKNLADYPHGIARAWQERVGIQSNGLKLVEIAERAVLASCAINSLSGEKLSATEMDAQNAGHEPVRGKARSSRVELYLPEYPYHPALAVVHRQSGFTDHVLAETGQVIGDEESGVAELWQGLLGCDAKGNQDGSKMKEFWNGWEDRMLE